MSAIWTGPNGVRVEVITLSAVCLPDDRKPRHESPYEGEQYVISQHGFRVAYCPHTEDLGLLLPCDLADLEPA